MPRLPTDFSKSIIYKIVCNDLTIKECYYGSTTDFIKRKSAHKCCCNNPKSKDYNTNKYQFIRENGGWGNWKMILIKEYPCDNKRQLEAEERKCMEEDNYRLNAIRPFVTDDENKERNKKYDQKHKVEIRERNKNYREKNPVRIKNYNKENRDKIKERQKNYRQVNKVEIKEKNKKYNQEHRVENSEQQRLRYQLNKLTYQAFVWVSSLS